MSKGWDKEFDASVGLSFSLKAFETYRRSGVLSAEVRSVPGIRGHCHAYLELTQGKVTSCYLIDRLAKRHSVPKELLLQLDDEKGPFGWIFREITSQATSTPTPAPAGHTSGPLPSRSPVLHRLVGYLDVKQLQGWTPQQQHYLNMIFQQVDGHRSIDEIKSELSLSPNMIEEGIHILIQLRVIGV